MHFNKVYFEHLAYTQAPINLTSQALEQKLEAVYSRLKLPEGRLEMLTGIKNRGLWPNGTKPSEIAYQAASNLFQTCGFDLKNIDLLIYAGVCRDQLEPATASNVHRLLGLSESCRYFDLSNACLGMMSAIEQASIMIESGLIKSALIVSGENAGPLLESTINKLNTDQSITRKSIKNYFANLTIGSAGMAILVNHEQVARNPQFKLNHSVSLVDSSANHLCQGGGDINQLEMQTDSEALMLAGVKLARKCFVNFCTEANLNHHKIDKVIGHQVGIAHQQAILQAMELEASKDFVSYPDFGNTGSCAIFLTLARALEAGFILPNQTTALLGIGSGLSSTMMDVTCKN
jgi:3-oxoacyl-[acyl-carrier-protein] synthase-3